MAIRNYDFCGWATKNNVKCSDGRTIMHNAFIDNDGSKVPMVWNHKHDSPFDVLGYAVLENRDEGVFAYGTFNDSDAGQAAKLIVQHGDVDALSIYANGLKQDSNRNVRHGKIRELSLVVAGANPQALIQTVLSHSDTDDLEEDEMFLSLSAEGCDIHLSHGSKSDADDEEDEDADADADDSDKGNGKKVDESKKKSTGSDDDEDDNKDDDESGELDPETEEDLDKVKKDGKLEHSDDNRKEDKAMADNKEKTVRDVFDSMTDEQKNVVYFMIGEALKKKMKDDDDEGGKDMKQNAFDRDNHGEDTYISHADFEQILSEAKRCGSLKEAVDAFVGDDGELAHSIDTTGMTLPSGNQTYGFNDPSMLFPEFKSLNTTPEWISRNMDWVTKVLGSVHRTPFSRIKSVFANITEDEARAKGYIKARQKKDEVFATLKRETGPQTIYKKQRMDRDDIVDITDFDVVAWIRAEMRVMLNEEIARAILIGDGRSSVSDEKIKEDCVRPIATDVPLFNSQIAIQVPANATNADKANAIIEGAIRGRKKYKGSGTPTLFTSETWLTEMLLLNDGIGHKLYRTEAELATALRVKEIVTVEVMEDHEITVSNNDYPLIGVIVNLEDYNVGADKGGAINLFDDFDIDVNQQKYLIETRISGALIKPYSALTLYLDQAQAGGNGGNGGNP